MLNNVIWFADRKLGYWRLVGSKIKGTLIKLLAVLAAVIGLSIFLSYYFELSGDWSLALPIGMSIGYVALLNWRNPLKKSLRLHNWPVDIDDPLFFFKIQMLEFSEYLVRSGVHSASQVEVLISHMRRRADQKSLVRFPIVAVLSFLGALLIVPYQRLIETGVKDYPEAKVFLISMVGICISIFSVFISARPYLLGTGKIYFATDAEKAERVLDLLENMHVDLVMHECKSGGTKIS